MYLLLDIGGTKIRLAVSKNGRTFSQPRIIDTPKTFRAGVSAISKVSRELIGDARVKAVAVGVPGPLDRQKTQILRAPNLAGWSKKPLKKTLAQVFKAPVFIENDTAVIGLGETFRGAGRGYDIVVYLTLSTGVGGVRIVNGKIDKNSLGFEPGHQIIQVNGNPKDLEQLISGKNLEKRFALHPKLIQNAKVWQQVIVNLTYGLNNVIVFWSPDVIILGGGLMKSPFLKVSAITQQLKRTVKIFDRLPIIKKASLQDFGGLYGGLELIKQNLK